MAETISQLIPVSIGSFLGFGLILFLNYRRVRIEGKILKEVKEIKEFIKNE